MPKKNGKTTVTEQNSYFNHLSGKIAIRKTGETKFDPESSQRGSGGVIEIKSARGSDLDTILLAATAQRSDITDLATTYQRKIGVNIRPQLKILEKKRAAYQAARHYHRPHLIDSHNKDAKKNIEQRSETKLGYEDSLRSVMYDIDLGWGVQKDEVAIAVATNFKDEMKAATESDDPLDNLIVATQMARFEEALRNQHTEDDYEEVEWVEEEDGRIKIKHPEGFGCFPVSYSDKVEKDEDGNVTKVEQRKGKRADTDKKGIQEAVEKIKAEGGLPPADLPTDGESDSGSPEWDKDTVEQSIAKTMDAYGSSAASGASTKETTGFKAEGESTKQETTQETLDRIRADMAIKAEEVGAINPNGLYGVHLNDIKILLAKQLEPLRRTTPVNLLLNQTRDTRGQRYTKVGYPSSKTWRTRLGDMQVFKRPPDTLGDVVVMTDMSGSMGCGCQECFDFNQIESKTCGRESIHIDNNPALGIRDRHQWILEIPDTAEQFNHINNGDKTLTCIPPTAGDFTRNEWSNGALAREVVTAISNRFDQTKVFGFSTGGYMTGTKIAQFPKGMYPNHLGMMEFGGGTPTCSAMDFMNDLLAGSMSRTAGVFIADGLPGKGGRMKDLPVQNCDSMHYRHLAESFAKRGMRFGVVSVGYSQFPTDIPNAKTAHIQSTDDLTKLVPLFNHLAGR